MKTWRDPDTGVVHAIDHEEGKAQKPSFEQNQVLHMWSVDEIARTFFRRVTMRCGIRLQVDSDECILPEGETLLASPAPILRPWLVGRDAPTCVTCAVAKSPQNEWRNEWFGGMANRRKFPNGEEET